MMPVPRLHHNRHPTMRRGRYHQDDFPAHVRATSGRGATGLGPSAAAAAPCKQAGRIFKLVPNKVTLGEPDSEARGAQAPRPSASGAFVLPRVGGRDSDLRLPPCMFRRFVSRTPSPSRR